MKKITLLFLLTLFVFTTYAQTVVWSSDSEDYATDWSILDNDGDGFDWGVYTGGAESFGFNSGALFYSESYDPGPPPTGLSPDNVLFSTTFFIPGTATSINFKMKVAALDSGYPAENFAVYVYDDAVGASFDDLIYEETLTIGGAGTAKDIMASIPVSFAGKTVGILIRHYACFDQNQLLVDDFEVSYGTLSIEDNSFSKVKVVALNKSIGLYNLQDVSRYSVINMTGQEVLKGETQNRDYIIEAPTLALGVYIVELNDTNSDGVIRKKVVLR